MLHIFRKKKFEKDIKFAKRRGKNLKKLRTVLTHLVNQNPLPSYYHDHLLKGGFADCRECHIEPDWLLIYAIEDVNLILLRTGSHSDLFK